ncbi:hypothetical protein PO909_011092 [Leuciscus waleckii]
MSGPQKEAVKPELVLQDEPCIPKPIYADFSANASLSVIYDFYVEELKRQETVGNKRRTQQQGYQYKWK